MRPQPSVRDASGISAAETELAAPNSVLVQGGSGVGDAGFKTVETTEATAEFFVFFVFLRLRNSEKCAKNVVKQQQTVYWVRST